MRRKSKLGISILFLLPVLGLDLAAAKTDTPARQNDAFVCGTGIQRQRDTILRSRYLDSLMRRHPERGRAALLSQAQAHSLQADFGNIAVMEDDGTLQTQYNLFDLHERSILFAPAADAAGTYRVSMGAKTFAPGAGTKLLLTDDSSQPIFLNPAFTFFGQSYSSVNVNSDGNLTFNEPDIASTSRDLGRFAWGPPRIGPLFSDLDPGFGSVYYRRETDGILFIWQDVPNWGTSQYNTFSVKLYDDGRIEFIYHAVVDATEAIAGISPGGGADGISAADFSSLQGPENLPGTIAEVFTEQPVLMETAVARRFYQTHSDEFDQLIVFLTFPYEMPGEGTQRAFSYELNVSNDVEGIGLNSADNSRDYGSHGRLKSFVLMGGLDKGTRGEDRFPDDPNTPFMRTYNTVGIIAHEAAHRWLAFPYLREGTLNSYSLLHPSDLSHWSFFFNAEASLMEGNQIVDLGAGLGNFRFRTSEVTNKFSDLDLYLMGFRNPEHVPPMFYVKNPTGAGEKTPDSVPDGRANNFGGTRFDFTVDNIIAANGARRPSALQAQKVHRVAFILVSNPAYPATPALTAKLQKIHDAFVPYFHEITGGQAWLITDLQSSPGTTPANIYFPFFEGDTQRYTGYAVANWGSKPADVLFRAFDNDGNELMNPAEVVNPRMITIPPRSQMALLGEQIHGLAFEGRPRNGWIQAQSGSSEVTGFFVEGDFSESLLDGAVAEGKSDTWLCFTRVRGTTDSLTNRITIVNPNAVPAHVAVRLFSADGLQQGPEAEIELPARGRLLQDLSGLFPGAGPGFTGYATVASDTGIIGYESFEGNSTAFSLPAQSMSTATTLYSAQFASGPPSGPSDPIRYFTDVNIVNASSEPRHIRVALIGNNGSPVPGVDAVDFQLGPGARKLTRGEELFGLENAAAATAITEGTLVVSADGPGILGDVSFGDPISAAFMAALPLDGTPRDRMVLSQVAQGVQGTGASYFTGIAMYNPNRGDVFVSIEVYSEFGQRTGNGTVFLESGRRLAKTLPELVPGFVSQMRGYIRLTSSGGPVVSFGIFGEASTVRFLAAIPPQPILQ
jgi:hypothetical protein